jgi:dienelactone hydrolase
MERGELRESSTEDSTPRGRYVAERVRLRSSTGLIATGVLYHPGSGSDCLPAVLLQDGREENSGVIARLPADFGRVVVLSLDYPAEIPYAIRLPEVMRHTARLQRAARKIPAIFSLGAAYLQRRPDVDSARIALTATSFAVPFAAIAAAMDPRFRNVALIYGAGDMPRVLAANLPDVPAPLRSAAARLAMEPFSAFAPERFIRRIAPRPVVMINGIDDPQMPAAAVQRLYDAANEPKSLVWLRTGHLMPTDSSLIRVLIDSAFARLPVLRDSSASRTCPVHVTARAQPFSSRALP